MELMERMKEIQRLQEEVEKWKAAAEGRLPRTKSNEMDPGFGMIATAFGGDIFIGRAKLSLKNCVLQYSGYNTLPLVVQREEHDGATLIVKTWPINEEGEVPFPLPVLTPQQPSVPFPGRWVGGCERSDAHIRWRWFQSDHTTISHLTTPVRWVRMWPGIESVKHENIRSV